MVLMYVNMADNIAQVLTSAVQALRQERASHEAEIRRIDALLAAIEKNPLPKSVVSIKRTERAPTPVPTNRVRRAEKNLKAKDFWAKRKAKRK